MATATTTQCTVVSKDTRDSEVAQDTQKVDDEMRQHWNDVAYKEFGVPSHYQSVAVLLIHWAKHLDKQLQCGEEVSVPGRACCGYPVDLYRRPLSSRLSSARSMVTQQGRLYWTVIERNPKLNCISRRANSSWTMMVITEQIYLLYTTVAMASCKRRTVAISCTSPGKPLECKSFETY